jgi:hypothetical protein
VKKDLLAGFIFLFGTGLLFGQGQGRLFLPTQGLGGYGEFALAPPHNEVDLNRCAASAGAAAYGGQNAPCSAFARYVTGGHFEARLMSRGPAKNLILFIEPQVFFGKNLPQTSYTWSADAIASDQNWGLIYEAPHNLEVRLTGHTKFHWIGKYNRNLGPADLGGDGPGGQYNTIAVRWKFGSWRDGRH